MSHYDNLSDEDKIKLARDAVRVNIPIAPAIASWLHENGLYDRVTTPRKMHDNETAVPG